MIEIIIKIKTCNNNGPIKILGDVIMKKIRSIVITIFFIAILGGCGSNETTSGIDNQDSVTTMNQEDSYIESENVDDTDNEPISENENIYHGTYGIYEFLEIEQTENSGYLLILLSLKYTNTTELPAVPSESFRKDFEVSQEGEPYGIYAATTEMDGIPLNYKPDLMNNSESLLPSGEEVEMLVGFYLNLETGPLYIRSNKGIEDASTQSQPSYEKIININEIATVEEENIFDFPEELEGNVSEIDPEANLDTDPEANLDTDSELWGRANPYAVETELNKGIHFVGTDIPPGRYVVTYHESGAPDLELFWPGNDINTMYKQEMKASNNKSSVKSVTVDLVEGQKIQITYNNHLLFSPEENTNHETSPGMYELSAGMWEVGHDIKEGHYTVTSTNIDRDAHIRIHEPSGELVLQEHLSPTSVIELDVELQQGQVIFIKNSYRVEFSSKD